MQSPHRIFVIAVLLLALLLPRASQGAPASSPGPVQMGATQFGPARGTLIIIGGGGKSLAIIQRFIKMSGGPDAPLVAIPTADEQDDKGERIAAFLRKVGSNNVTVLHTRDPKVADTEEFVKPLL